MDFKHTSIKQSALGWVKKSIDDNLASIRSELNIYVEEKDASVLSSVQAKLADIQGVLTMIEQYGAAMLTEEMRSLCEFIASKDQQDEQALEVLLRAVLQLPDYLEHIQAGQKDIPIAILPILNDIRAAKNEDLFSEKLLFLPDLSMHMDDSELDEIDDAKNQASRLLAKKVRPAYQFSLLGVIRDKDVEVHLKRLGKITEILEERSLSEQVARFWWIVGALIESVSRDDLTLGMSVKMLLGKIDPIFRSMILHGEKDLLRQQPIELIKNFLYYIAQPECNGPKSQAIKTAYRLEQFLPSEDEQNEANIAGPNQELLKTVSDAVKADLEQVKSAIEVYVNGDMSDTEQLQEIPRELHIISDTLAMIGLGPQRQIIEAQISIITDVVEGKMQADQDKFLDMAAELLQVDQALELMHKGQFLQHEDEEVAGQTASKNFEMDNMLSGVVTAALDDIQKIKDAILDFIKDSTKEENLQMCRTLLVETRGALDLLNQDRAVAVVEGLARYLNEQDIVEFMDTRRLDQLSQVVVSIEYFLEALGEQRSDADSILDFADSQLQLLLAGKTADEDDITQSLGDHENLLIDDGSDDDGTEVIEDLTGLIKVDLDNMEEELQDKEPPAKIESASETVSEKVSTQQEVDIKDSAASQVGAVVNDINNDLEQLQDVLDSDAAVVPDDGGIDAEEIIPLSQAPESVSNTEESTTFNQEEALSFADESVDLIDDDLATEPVADDLEDGVIEQVEEVLEDDFEIDFQLEPETDEQTVAMEVPQAESAQVEATTQIAPVAEQVQETVVTEAVDDDSPITEEASFQAPSVEQVSEDLDAAPLQEIDRVESPAQSVQQIQEASTVEPATLESAADSMADAEDLPPVEEVSTAEAQVQQDVETIALAAEAEEIAPPVEEQLEQIHEESTVEPATLESEADSMAAGEDLPPVEEQLEEFQVAASAADEELEEGMVRITPVIDDMPVLKPGSDPDILEIYLEEAEEESEHIKQQQQDWKLHPEDENALKNIRRSFHTIKGSGRLVGAMKIGEFAWDFESLLNRVIDRSVEPSSQVIDAIGLSAEALPQLVEELKTEKPPTADIPYIRGLARALAEFKADKVLEIRKTKHQSVDQSTEVISPDQDNEDVSDEPEPAVDQQQDVTPGDAAEQVEAEPAVATETVPEEKTIEETPPDPFVLNEAEPMPDVEAEADLSASQPATPRLAEPQAVNELQIDPELLVIYQQEVESHLSTVNSVLDQVHDNGELIPTEDLYRAIHTIHGASRTADITSIGQLASLLEKPLKKILEQGSGFDQEVLQLYREGSAALSAMTTELVEQRLMPELPEHLQEDLEALFGSMEHHTVELPEQEDEPSSQFIDTLTMMNESAAMAADSDYDDELVEIFIEEATDLLEMSDHTLHAWAGQDSAEQESAGYGLVMELQRYLHTLKGGAKMAGFKEISDLSHELESLFIALIDNRVDKSEDLVAGLHECFDLLQKQVEQAKSHQPLDSSAEQVEILQRIRSGQTEEEQVLADDQDAQLKELPDEMSPAEFDDRRHPEEHHRRSSDSGIIDRRTSDQEVVKVRSDLLDNLVNSAGEVSIYRARMEQQVSSFGSNLGELGQTILRLKNQLRALEAETDAQIHFSHRQDVELTQSFDPLELDRYTQIQELSKSLSESVDDLSSLQHILGDQVKDSETLLLQQSRINTDLQDGLIRSRMVRFSGLTSRLRRLVRQTCAELAKKAELEIQGEQNEVDIKVLDRMVAPLEHIIRNAISHGIESPMERINKGKPESGTILIEVSRDGSDVVVKISDDGAGVNVDKVRGRALQLGLLGKDEKLEDNDVIQFILEPGFSTADSVTQIAGRGVGMDVVDSSIKQLGGTLQISTSAKGTVFTARLPFTLSINQAILVRAGEESYALPLINIEGITRIESDQMMEFYQDEKPTLDYAGQSYSLYYLTSLLEISNGFHVSDPTSKVPVILLRSGDLRVALHIDEIIGNREIVVKPLGRQLSQVKGLSGASILADGLVVLILDINGLIRHGITTQVFTEIEQQQESLEEAGKKLVMVVDDSITMRRVATKLLTRNQYEVITAKDGVDALAQLEESNPDVMLLDIEMPRMDGFELATHMQNESRLRDIPIIMITSRTGSKHREHAMQLGVNKYMGKPYQESELIENIAELVG